MIETLLANMGAVIPRAVFGDLVALSQGVEAIRKPLVARKDMPKDIAHQMFWFVSAAMRQTILEKFAVDPKELDAVFAEVLPRRSAPATGRACRRGRAARSTRSSPRRRRATSTASRRRSAQAHRRRACVAAKIVADAGGEPLAIACKAVGADRSQFTTIFLQLDYKRFGKARPIAHVQNVSRIYDLVPKEKAIAAVAAVERADPSRRGVTVGKPRWQGACPTVQGSRRLSLASWPGRSAGAANEATFVCE